MSLLLRDQVRIALTRDKVVGVRVRRGYPARIGEMHAVRCSPDPGAPTWSPVLTAARELLPCLGPAPADVTFILSNRFVRYTIVPWSAELVKVAEELAFTRHCFAAIYGAEVDAWDFRLSPGASGESRLASAVDIALIAELKSLVTGTHLRLRSVQPYLMSALNLCRAQMSTDNSAFLAAETGLYTSARIVSGRWASVHTEPMGACMAETLDAVIAREHAWGAAQALRFFLYAPEEPQWALPPTPSASVSRLALEPRFGFSPLSDAPFAMAMSAP